MQKSVAVVYSRYQVFNSRIGHSSFGRRAADLRYWWWPANVINLQGGVKMYSAMRGDGAPHDLGPRTRSQPSPPDHSLGRVRWSRNRQRQLRYKYVGTLYIDLPVYDCLQKQET